MAVVGQTATAFFDEDDVKNLRTGIMWKAKIQPVADMVLNEAMGRDARESCTFHFRDKKVVADINMTDRLLANGETYVVLRRTNNPISIHTEYGCMKLTEKDQ